MTSTHYELLIGLLRQANVLGYPIWYAQYPIDSSILLHLSTPRDGRTEDRGQFIERDPDVAAIIAKASKWLHEKSGGRDCGDSETAECDEDFL